jgi:hypothetical protein
MARSKIPLGLSSTAVTSIPEKWSAQWFRSFITSYMQSADIRNTNSGIGISITSGNSVAAPGTVSLTTEITNLLAEPYILAGAPVAGSGLTGYRTIANGSGIALTDGGAEGAFSVALAPIANDTVLGNISGAPAAPVPISQTQLTALINLATTALPGAMPVLPNDPTQFLNGVGNFSVPAYPAAANPSASVGLAAVNGVATTWMRSDAAPALSQAIAPTWTGLHNFTGGLEVNGVAVSTAAGANPSASVGLAAVNGSATTFMRSDGAPALSQAIVPTWTGAHTFAPSSAVTAVKASAFSAATLAFDFVGLDNSNVGYFRAGGTNGGNCVLYDTGASTARGYIGFGPGGIMSGGAITDFGISAGSGGTVRIPRAGVGVNAFAVGPNGNVTIAAPSSGVALAVTGTATVSSGLGVNGASAPAQVTGWGTPAGPAVVAAFPATPTLAQCGAAIGEIIVALKAVGIFGA